jgi:uncharacterized phage protein (TIGR01671 family)
MREIKFRGYNTKTKKMLDLLLATPLALSDNTINGLFLPFYDYIKLMQYTGLKDKHGKEIYEGDILKNESRILGHVRYGVFEPDDDLYSATMGFFIDDGITYEPGDYPYYSGLYSSSCLEVVGNIYENQELLPKRD